MISKNVLAAALKTDSVEMHPVSGGDINQAALVTTNQGDYFVKYNDHDAALAMLKAEAFALEKLKAANAIAIPEVYHCGQAGGSAFLIMQYIESEIAERGLWEVFARQLADLHRNTALQFGWEEDNFIGTLPQRNSKHDSWISFYIHERIDPQLKMAVEDGKISPSVVAQFQKLYAQAGALFPVEPPALIHGDLWAGNFITAYNQTPYLIDPAACYAHREMDIAMAHLFGGFHPFFFESYHEAFPLALGFYDRLPLYQLYYLLAHVNLFGGSYVQSVLRILEKF